MSVHHAMESMAERVKFNPDEGVAITYRKIGKSGNSTVIRIPPSILEVAGLEYDDRVRLTADMDDGTITIHGVDDME